jgi:hypothetical protein
LIFQYVPAPAFAGEVVFACPALLVWPKPVPRAKNSAMIVADDSCALLSFGAHASDGPSHPSSQALQINDLAQPLQMPRSRLLQKCDSFSFFPLATGDL